MSRRPLSPTGRRPWWSYITLQDAKIYVGIWRKAYLSGDIRLEFPTAYQAREYYREIHRAIVFAQNNPSIFPDGKMLREQLQFMRSIGEEPPFEIRLLRRDRSPKAIALAEQLGVELKYMETPVEPDKGNLKAPYHPRGRLGRWKKKKLIPGKERDGRLKASREAKLRGAPQEPTSEIPTTIQYIKEKEEI